MISLWEWPQWVIAVWYTLALIVSVVVPKMDNRLTAIIANILVVVVLYQGGFFGG